MAEIAGDVPYAVQDFGIWTAGTAPDTGEELFIGGTARVVFSSPIPSVDRDWPDAGARPYYSSWPPEERAKYLPYKQGTETFAVNNLRHAWVKVDLTRERLVEIAVSDEPQDGQTVTYEQAGPTPVYTQGVPTIATDIFNSDEQIAALLSGRTYNTGAIYTFTVGDVHLASVYAAFEQPQDIEGDWMLLFDFNLETGEYETHTMHFKATEVQAVGAVINLDKGRVAWVEPNAHFND